MNLLVKYQYWILAALAVLILPFYLSSSCVYFYEWLADNPIYQDRFEHLMTRYEFQDKVYWLSWKACAVVATILAAVAVTWELARRK